MIAPHFNSLCKQAELYYYDFTIDENDKSIPEFLIDHIEHCQNCRMHISQLNSVLSKTKDYDASKHNQAGLGITAMLKLHFAYINEPVTCDVVKPFLPNLSDIRVPTPITAHLNHCPKCYEDSEAIRELNLSHKQSRLLSQLFAHKTTSNNISCAEAQEAIPSVASMVFSETNAETLMHLCSCPQCNKLLYQHREMAIRGLLRTSLVPHEFPCEKVSARDFFDYVIPYGINPTNDQYVKFRESLISHLRTCPDCLTKMQEVHAAIYKIYTRVESDVVTTYQIDESAKNQAISQIDDLYAGFPIKVDVKQREEIQIKPPVSSVDFTSTSNKKVSARKFAPLIKTGAVAAAVIFTAAVLLHNIPTAGASALEKIYDAVVKVQNVHIASYVPDHEEPVQEKWVSRSLNMYMNKTGEKCVLWDIANSIRKMKSLDTGITETNKLTTENIADIEKEIGGSVGLIPFYGISNIPENSEWSRVANEDLENAVKGVEAYDLMWAMKGYTGSLILNKWRFFVDSKTNLPERTEFYQKLPTEDEYIFISSMEVEYLSDTEMLSVIKDVSF